MPKPKLVSIAMRSLHAEVTDPLEEALTITTALALAGHGMKSIGCEQGEAIIVLADILSSDLAKIKSGLDRARVRSSRL